MVGLEVVGDIGGMWQESVQSVSTGLAGLGADELAGSAQYAADALDVFAGLAQMVGSLAALITTVNSIKAAEAASLAAAYSATGIGLTNVAIAGAAMAGAAVVTYAILDYTLTANLSNPAEASAVAQTVGVLA